MKLLLHRILSGEDATIGYLEVDGKFFCFTCEDEDRKVKVSGETRIPWGSYLIEQRKVLSPMTTRYRQKYDWFEWHLELQNVPNFTNVYIHIGNTDDDTDGCILVGETADCVNMFVGRSTSAFKALYQKICAALNNGEKVWIEIIDEG